MASVRTKNCSRHGHPEFRLTFDPGVIPVESDVVWLTSWLEDAVENGTRFTSGETCQIGWVTTLVRQHESGDLSLWEPDMQHTPIVWSESVSVTLAHIRVQKDVVASVLSSTELSFPSMRQSGLVCTRLHSGEDVVLERVQPDGRDSGWFCGCADRNHDHNNANELKAVSLYEAAMQAPQIIPYLALPAGALLVTQQGVPTIFQNGELREFLPGSYLAMRYSGRESS